MAPPTPNSQSPTLALAAFAAEMRYEDLPAEVPHQTKRCLLDYLGLVIGASDEPAVCYALATVEELGGSPQARVLGTAVRTSAPQAALVNGIASHVLDYDDTHLPSVIHPTGPAMSAALAVGEWKGASGRELVTAFAVGFEVECRVGLSVHPEHYDAGWHITGTAGTFGAAAAAGRLLGLDPRRMSWALGMAGSQAAGVREQFGTMSKSLHIGKAAANGLLGAVLAIEARVHPLVLELTGKREPQVGLEGKFSVYHCAAIALIEGHARPGQFSDEAVNRPDAVELRRKVSATADPALAEHQTEVAITLT